MAQIPLPRSTSIIRRVEWTLDRPAQVNRSGYTGVRQVVANPWHGQWRARVELKPIVGEGNVRAWRAFIGRLKGQINTFRLPATEGAQNGNSGVTVGVTAVAGATAMTIAGAATPLLAGQFVTCMGQLLQLTLDQSGTLINFEPPLRATATAGTPLVTSRPYALVSLVDSAAGWSVDQGQQYGISFDVEEAILESDGTAPETGAPTLTYAISAPDPSSIIEGDGGSTLYSFRVDRAGEIGLASTIAWAIVGTGGSPASSGDFDAPLSGVLSFGVGESVKLITVAVKGDTADESDEGFVVTLSAPSLGTITTASAAATIVDDDDSGIPPDDGLAPTYDTRFGLDPVATATDGWFRFGKKAGTTDTYVDSLHGSDAATGNGYGANAKATWAAAWPLFLSRLASNPGSRLLVAYGEGQAYDDPGTLTSWANSGYDQATASQATMLAYPSLVQTYDSRDPTNTAVFGRSTGADRVYLTLATTGTPCLAVNDSSSGKGGFFVQGLSLRTADGDTAVGIQILGRHDVIGFQNFVANRVTITNQNSTSPSDRTQIFHCSKFASFGQWSPSGSIAFLIGDYIDGTVFEDYAIFHAGWRIGLPRSGADASGGPSFFSHGIYFHASNGQGTFRRRLYGDSAADGDNLRGPALREVGVFVREPICSTLGGYSGGQAEAPTGVVHMGQDELLIDGAPIDDISPRAFGYNMTSCISPSQVDNVLAINNSQYGVTNNCFLNIEKVDNASVELAFPTSIHFSRLTTFNWTPQLRRDSGGDQSARIATFSEAITDTLAPGSGNSTSDAGDFPGEMSNQQIYAAVLAAAGITANASEEIAWSQLVNIVCHDPTQPWPQKFFDVTFPAYAKTPTFATAAIANLSSAVAAEVYPIDTTAATLSSPTGVSSVWSSATIGATTNRGNGILYGVVTTSATAPTAAQIKAGQDHTGAAAVAAGSAIISSIGARTFSVAGTAGSTTYYAHLMQETATGNQSNVVNTASFTTPAGGLGPELLSNGTFASAGPPPSTAGSATISGGVLTCTSSTVDALWTGVLTAGHTYRVQLDYTTSGTVASLRVEDGAGTRDIKPLSSGSHTMIFADFVAVGTSVKIAADGDYFTGSIDNVSCKEVL